MGDNIYINLVFYIILLVFNNIMGTINCYLSFKPLYYGNQDLVFYIILMYLI